MDNLYMYKATVDRVIDGDTVEATVNVGFHLTTKIRLRLNGIDTPERGEENWSNATEFTKEHLEGKDVIVQTYKSDVFGRYLADIWYSDDEHLIYFNNLLKNSGLLKPNSKWND